MEKNIIQKPVDGPQGESISHLFTISEILTVIADTQIDKVKLTNYLDPQKTEPQSLKLVTERMQTSLLWKVKQDLAQTQAAVQFPDSMNAWGEIAALGTATKYILEVNGEKAKPGENTHPFTGTSWDLSTEEVATYADGVSAEMENAKTFLDPENNILPHLPDDEKAAIPFIRALCYLKVRSLL